VSHIIMRLNEAEKLGFKRCIVPKNNLKSKSEIKLKTLQLVPVANVREALDIVKG